MRALLLSIAILGMSICHVGRAQDALPIGATLRLGAGGPRMPTALQHIAVSPDGGLVAATSAIRTGKCNVWNATTGETVFQADFASGGPIFFSEDGKLLNLLATDLKRKSTWKRWNTSDWTALPDKPVADNRQAYQEFALAKGERYRAEKSKVGNSADIRDMSDQTVLFSVPVDYYWRLEFAPDGNIVVVQSTDMQQKTGGMHVWDMKLKKQTTEIPGINPQHFLVLPGGKQMVTSQVPDGPVLLWNLETGKQVRTLMRQGASQLRLSPDGKRLFAARMVRGSIIGSLLDLTADKPAREIELGGGGSAGALPEFSGDNRVLVIPQINAVRIWDLKEDKFRFDGGEEPAGPVEHLAITADRRLLATSNGSRIHVWDLAKNTIVHSFPAIVATRIRFSPKGDAIAIARNGQPTTIHSLADLEKPLTLPPEVSSEIVATARLDGNGWARGQRNGEIELSGFPGGGKAARPRYLRFTGHTDAVKSLTYAPDGRTLISRGVDRVVRIWNADDGKLIREIVCKDDPNNLLAISNDRSSAAWFEGGKLQLYDVKSDQRVTTVDNVVAMAFDPLNARLAVVGKDFVALAEPTSGKLTKRYSAETKQLLTLTYSPDGKRLYVTAADGGVSVLNAETLEFIETLDVGVVGTTLRFSNDGDRLIIGSRQRYVVWDMTTGKKLGQVSDRNTQAYAHVRVGDREMLTMLNIHGRYASFDARTGMAVGTEWTSQEFRPENDCDFAPTGELISSSPGGARIWDMQAKAIVDVLADFNSYCGSVSVSPNGKRVALGGDGISIWSLAERKVTLRIEPPFYDPPPRTHFLLRTSMLKHSRDGRLIVASDAQHVLRIYSTESGKELVSTLQSIDRNGRPKLPYHSIRSLPVFTPDNRMILASLVVEPAGEYELVGIDTLSGRIAWRDVKAFTSIRSVELVDGNTVITGAGGGSITFWDLEKTLNNAFPPQKMTVDEAWAQLASADAAIGWQAVSTLRSHSEEALAKISTLLEEKAEFSDEEYAEIVTAIASSSPAQQAAAMAQLIRAGDGAERHLDSALKLGLSAEVRQQLNQLRDAKATADYPATLLPQRVVQVLEAIGDARAKKHIERLATGRIWRLAKSDANAALERLNNRVGK